MLDAAMIEGAWKASPWAMSEDGRDCHFWKASSSKRPRRCLRASSLSTAPPPQRRLGSRFLHCTWLLMAY